MQRCMSLELVSEAENQQLVNQKSFGYDGICKFIPQRPPFLMIDKVIDIDVEAKKAVCQKCLSANEPFFQGHFPGNPVMPGVLMVEAMAQAASIIGRVLLEDKQAILLFTGANDVKFKGMATVGDVLTITANVTKIRGPLIIGDCEVKKGDEIIATATITAFNKRI